MATVVKNYRNSFIEVINEEIRILMDPWVTTANEGSWAASKNGDNYIFDSLKTKEVDYIYISHLHTDHFDLKFLKKLKKKQKKILKL
jgi:L-ascorbate metabolism protein UlaG (beta-lactamase superfamily)